MYLYALLCLTILWGHRSEGAQTQPVACLGVRNIPTSLKNYLDTEKAKIAINMVLEETVNHSNLDIKSKLYPDFPEVVELDYYSSKTKWVKEHFLIYAGEVLPQKLEPKNTPVVLKIFHRVLDVTQIAKLKPKQSAAADKNTEYLTYVIIIHEYEDDSYSPSIFNVLHMKGSDSFKLRSDVYDGWSDNDLLSYITLSHEATAQLPYIEWKMVSPYDVIVSDLTILAAKKIAEEWVRANKNVTGKVEPCPFHYDAIREGELKQLNEKEKVLYQNVTKCQVWRVMIKNEPLGDGPIVAQNPRQNPDNTQTNVIVQQSNIAGYIFTVFDEGLEQPNIFPAPKIYAKTLRELYLAITALLNRP